MALLGLLFLMFVSLVSYVHGYGGGWIDAHATFYGGGDASGTMGKSQNYALSLLLYIYIYFHASQPQRQNIILLHFKISLYKCSFY